MIRTNITKVALLLLMAGITSCDVERLPETTLSDQSFWISENDIKLAANYLYTRLPTLPVTNDVWSDDAFGTNTNQISDGTRIPGATDGSYNSNYVTIRAANNIIEKSSYTVAAGIAQKTVDAYVAEARYFRAFSYFSLLQRFGGVPLILTTLKENSPELEAPQASREEIIDAIYADLDFATLNLKTRTQLGLANYGRVSKTAALALKSRVALFEGTRCKFHNYGDATKHLNIAKDAANQVILSNEHALFNNYFHLFQYEGNGFNNKENILVRIYGVSNDNNVSSHNSQRNLEQGAASPTKALADSYLMNTGLPPNLSTTYSTTIDDVFKNRDPRMSATFFKTGDAYIGSQPVFNIPSLAFQKTGFANRRYANPADWQLQRSYMDLAVIRYAEVLLNYAEATYELGGTISDADLDKSINLLRARVTMPKLTNAFVSTNALNMRDEIRRERRVELALEGYRYWDLLRWKTAEIELPKSVLGNYYFKQQFGTVVTPLLDPNGFILLQNSSLRSFNPSRDYLWPFPINEMALNPNLKQNPNW
jgi:hypothetical protein